MVEGVCGEEGDDLVDVAAEYRLHKLGDELVLGVWGGGEARPFVAHLFFGTAIDLAAVGGRLFDDGGDFVVAVVEDIAQEKDGPLARCKLL